MASKNIPRDLLTLILAVLLGAGLARWRSDGVPDLCERSSAHVGSRADHGSTTTATSSSSRLQSQVAISCASAWESLKDGRLSRGDRFKAQQAILNEWARHDLTGALVAFYSDPHQRNTDLYGKEGFDPLTAMATYPETVEELLKSGRLGLQTNDFRDLWFRHLKNTDPIGVFDRLGELSAGKRYDMLHLVASLLPSIAEDPVTWQAGLDRVSARIATDPWSRESLAIGLGSGNSFEDLNAAYLATGDPSLRELLASAARYQALPDDPFADNSVIPEKIQSLPEPFRSAVIAEWKEHGSGEVQPSPPE